MTRDEFMKHNTNTYNGIRIIDCMNLSVPKSVKFFNIIPLMLIAFLGIWGTVFSYISMFNININTNSIKFYSIFFFIIFSILFTLPKKFKILLFPILLFYIFLLYKKWTYFIAGFKIVFNQTYTSIHPEKKEYFKIQTINNKNDAELFIAFTVFILVFLICYITLVHPNFFIGFLGTFPFIECGLYFGKIPDMLPILMLLIYWTCLITIQYSGYYQYSGKKTSGFLRKNNIFFAKPEIKFRTAGISGLLIVIICCIIFSFIKIISDFSGYSRSDKINQVRSNIKNAASEFSFEDLGTSLERFSASLGIGNSKIYNHKLGNLNSVSFSETTDLIIETNLKIHDNVYLKGYTGTEYQNNKWIDFSNSLYQSYNDMFSNFYKNETFPQDMLTDYYISKYPTDLVDMKIKSKYNNEKYNYIPYISIPNGEITYINDTITKLENFKEYSFKVSTDQFNENNFYEMINGNNYNSNYSFKQYTDFVYENYCSIPDTNDMKYLYEKFIVNSDILNENIYQKLNSIKKILSDNAEYSLSPGKTPNSEDFVYYFLTQNHKGYCVHFATSGVILARMAGIPARYAEGYVLLSDDFNEENFTEKNTYKVDIKDSRAHAWAEIYIDNLGWVPYEFTPSAAAAFENNTNTTHSITQSTTSTSETIITSVSSTPSKTDLSENTHLSSSEEQKLTPNETSSNEVNNNQEVYSAVTFSSLVKIILFTSVIMIIVFILIKHFVIVNKRNDMLTHLNNRKKSLIAYDYIIKLLEFKGITNSNMQYIDFALYAQQETENIFDADEFLSATHIALKAKWSMEPIEDEEANYILELSLRTAKKIYSNLSIFKKIYMKLLKNLI